MDTKMATIRGPLPVAASLNGLLNPLCSLPTDCLGLVAAFLCDKDFRAICNAAKHLVGILRVQWPKRRWRYDLQRHISWLAIYKSNMHAAVKNYNRYLRVGHFDGVNAMEECYERYKRAVASIELEIWELQRFGPPR